MMGASAIALTEMIHKTVDINPPKVIVVRSKEDLDQVNGLSLADEEMTMVVCHMESKGLLKGIMIRIYLMTETRYICDNFKVN